MNKDSCEFPDVLFTTEPVTIGDVVKIMRCIDAALPDNDGLKWFNRVYLLTTEHIYAEPVNFWEDYPWLSLLDVNFAKHYFQALRNWYTGQPVTSSWRALLEARFEPEIDRIQYALAGMNAHIDYDLTLAVFDSNEQCGVTPGTNSPQYRDYQRVNDVLKVVMPLALSYLHTGIWGKIVDKTGPLGELIGLWEVVEARNLAWDFSVRRRKMGALRTRIALALRNAITGMLSRLLLLPLDPTQKRHRVRSACIRLLQRTTRRTLRLVRS